MFRATNVHSSLSFVVVTIVAAPHPRLLHCNHFCWALGMYHSTLEKTCHRLHMHTSGWSTVDISCVPECNLTAPTMHAADPVLSGVVLICLCSSKHQFEFVTIVSRISLQWTRSIKSAHDTPHSNSYPIMDAAQNISSLCVLASSVHGATRIPFQFSCALRMSRTECWFPPSMSWVWNLIVETAWAAWQLTLARHEWLRATLIVLAMFLASIDSRSNISCVWIAKTCQRIACVWFFLLHILFENIIVIPQINRKHMFFDAHI